MMLGEIRGRSAGDAVTEPCRFLLPRGASCGVLLAVGVEDPGLSIGLWLADIEPDFPKAGDGIDCINGVFAELDSAAGCDNAGAPREEN